MGQAGQDDRETFHANYQPRNAGVDGQATFLGGERRDAVNDAFRDDPASQSELMAQPSSSQAI